jgi:uroporphyrinogen decarboxylase
MNSRQRFNDTMHYGNPDRVPYIEEGIREEVITAWREQGLSPDADLVSMFSTDRSVEIRTDIEPRPAFEKWPSTHEDLDKLRSRLDLNALGRLPEDWAEHVRYGRNRDHVIMLRVSHGFYESLGVDGSERFTEVNFMLMDKPGLVHDFLTVQGDFETRMAERVLSEVEVDAAVFSEPIGGNQGPLISPRMYEDFVLRHYEPLLDVLRRHGVETIIFRTYANARALIPSILKWGFNCMWACEVNLEAMDYRDLRREFGRDLRLIGGIDLDSLRLGKEAIKREIEEKVPPLVADGGYVPLADGRVRPDMPLENYLYYRNLLEQVTQG